MSSPRTVGRSHVGRPSGENSDAVCVCVCVCVCVGSSILCAYGKCQYYVRSLNERVVSVSHTSNPVNGPCMSLSPLLLSLSLSLTLSLSVSQEDIANI